MVKIASHLVRMSDVASNGARLGPLAGRRGAHLKHLEPLEDLLRSLAPLPVSYDVTRTQPPFFNEFCYTEMLGGLYVCPQSSELAARVVQFACDRGDLGAFDPTPAILGAARDKYDLGGVPDNLPRRVAMLPGSNVFDRAVCRETLTRHMHADPALIVKPHPLTNEETLRKLGQLFGYHRIADPQASGWAYLNAADEVLVTSTSEMGLYAVLLGKPIVNITKVMFEARATFGPFYRLLWGKPPADAQAALVRALGAMGTGFVRPEDPAAEERFTAIYGLAMELRERFQPLVLEYDQADYATMVLGSGQRGL